MSCPHQKEKTSFAQEKNISTQELSLQRIATFTLLDKVKPPSCHVCVCHGLTPSPPSPPHIGVTCTVASALKAANHSSTALWLPFLGGKGGQNPSDTAHPPSICSLTKMPVVISKTDWVDFFPKKTRV